MEKVCGILQITAPKTVSWKIGNKNSSGVWSSDWATTSYNSNSFRFLIQPNEKKEIETGRFYMLERINDVLKTWDLNISLIYSHESKWLERKNIKPAQNETCFLYGLATIKTNDLVEIKCTFLKSEVWNGTIRVILGPASVHETGESSRKRKYEEIVKERLAALKRSSTVVKENSIVVKESSKAVKENSTVVKESSKAVKENSTVVKESSNAVKENSTVVKESSTAVKENSTVVKESSTAVKENSTVVNVKEENTSVEQNTRINTRGLDALSGNLKNAFLSGEDTDVVFKVGQQEYRAHKVILKNRSPVFYSMLRYDMVGKNQRIVDVSDCDSDIFQDFLLYLYSGKADCMSKRNVFDLYYMSDKYDVGSLKFDCVDFILNNLDVDIICNVIALATQHLEQEMLKRAISFFIRNAKEIFLTSNWQKFIKEYPTQANELVIKAFNEKS